MPLNIYSTIIISVHECSKYLLIAPIVKRDYEEGIPL
jgi:hypothetical protein